jgi:hypothetical protein
MVQDHRAVRLNETARNARPKGADGHCPAGYALDSGQKTGNKVSIKPHPALSARFDDPVRHHSREAAGRAANPVNI